MELPERVYIGDVTPRDGLQALEHFYSTEAKVRLVEELVLAGFKHVEVTNLGHPMKGSRVTDLNVGVEFSKRYLEIGADYIEQADHDGSADPARVFEYFTMILDPAIMGTWADPQYHLAHFHTTRGMGLANCPAALQAGIIRFETTLSGTGGQPASIVDGEFTGGTGQYYHFEHLYSGLQSTEDFVVMLESMGVKTGISIPKLLEVGRMFRDESSPPVVPAPVRRPSRAHLNLVPLEAKLRLVMVLLGEIPPLAFGSVGMTGQSRAKLSFRPRSRRSRATSGGISPR